MRRRAFPIPWRWKWPVGAVAWLVALKLYAVTNAWCFPRAPVIQLSGLDAAIPFLPWTAWVYWTGWLFVGTCWYLAASSPCFHRQLYAFCVAVAGSCAAFALYPARYPRETALPEGTHWLNARALEALWRIDLPSNTAPSLHASLAVVLALELRRPDRGYPRAPHGLLSLWALGLVASAVTTRQHTTWDAATGVAVGVAVHFLVGRWTRA